MFGRRALFEPCVELRPTFAQLLSRPDALALLPAERHPTKRPADEVPDEGVLTVSGLKETGELVAALTERAEAERREREAMYATEGAMMTDVDGGDVMGSNGGPSAPPPSLMGGGGAGGPEAPPDMNDDDD